MISILVARARNRVIGRSNDLPWYLPADLRHFKELTTGHSVLMGRKTFDSILARLGTPLPNRQNIVVTRDRHFQVSGAIVVHSIDEALKLTESEEVFVIGGAQIYEQVLPFTDRMYITEVAADIDGDTFFPELEQGAWRETSREPHKKDDKNQYDYAFVVYERQKPTLQSAL